MQSSLLSFYLFWRVNIFTARQAQERHQCQSRSLTIGCRSAISVTPLRVLCCDRFQEQLLAQDGEVHEPLRWLLGSGLGVLLLTSAVATIVRYPRC